MPTNKNIEYQVSKNGRIIGVNGQLYTTQYGGSKCRCLICGRKNAGSNKVRNSYLLVGLGRDENGRYYGCESKRHSRKVRRIRERRSWLNDMANDNI